VGTCNDGVGKGASGGRIIVSNPGGGSDQVEGNVLVGNFALFGATGGELFVEGQAGDRFGVRNSGAVAVVEGVGDFCCEYMTNGTIVNLGSFGKGFGNGMSGGTAYQYDPTGAIAERCSRDSVTVCSLEGNDPFIEGQCLALRYHLETHLEHTGSALAADLLSRFDEVRSHLYVLIPNALYQLHRNESILGSTPRKQLLDELSQAWALWHVRRLQKAYGQFERLQKPIFAGQVPTYGECDTDLIFQYVNAAGILRRALEVANKSDMVQAGVVSADAASKHLIESEDRKLMEVLYKDLKEALASFDDKALAALLADKRIRDYKESLMTREVWDTRAFGTTVWILESDRQNRSALSVLPSLEMQLAAHYGHVLAEVMRDAA
jgi:glutamate synthase (NADPH/NADH) large chain